MIDTSVDPVVTGIQITITGVSIVFIVLTIVALALGALRASQNLFQPRKNVASMPEPANAPVIADQRQLDPQLIAILTAAAMAALERPLRVRRVRYYQQPAATWTRLGRISVMASRQLRK